MRLVFLKAFPDTYRQSMRVYADHLQEALRPLLAPEDSISSFLPPRVWLSPKVARYWSQYVEYPLHARNAQGDINHVVDHAYGHLLHALDPTRSVVTFHDAISWKTRADWARRHTLSGIRKAAAVICVSESTRKEFLRRGGYPPEKTTVIYEGVEENFFRAPTGGSPKNRFGLAPGQYLLHVGHTKPYKNIPALFQVLAILTRSLGTNVKLLKVGAAFTPEQVKLAKGLGVWSRTVHLGIVSRDLLPDIYRCADVFLFPSLDEGFGLPALEAMASGLPVVASNRGALPEVVGDAGILVEPSDAGGMAKAAVSILEQPALRVQLVQRGQTRARLFTWERAAQQTLSVYREVYRSRRPE